ncbi:tRNA (adenosine(37)-N6)-threonylcarbamoyltransferase complex dimerization subunit type 1 TsaB [Craterilacuibacter sp.]|uniref:tRNA (adenosine(37)-N6)-threonylcarbamoyltransferase complex dimerization subunit type 1 TsaB n=1 Tax=Craterilacuibacter sp. TaxID=2870909 RepID=UPI003F344C1A
MNLLSIDTSTDHLSLAIRHHGKCVLFHQQVGQKHAELLLPTLQTLLAELAIGLHQLDAITFSQGPGSFTGIRIGCAIAQGLAFANHLPIIAIPTLDTIAIQATGKKSLVCMDARMGQVYSACYDAQGVRLDGIRVCNPEEIILQDGHWNAIGDGFLHYESALLPRLSPLLDSIDATLRPHANALITLADSGRYPALPAHQTEILYVRNKIALTTHEQKASRK